MPTRAGTLLGAGTLNNPNDLTRIGTPGGVLEFLDLTATTGQSVANALTNFGGAGFTWATGAQVAELFAAFGITYSSVPASFVDLGAGLAERTNFISFLGVTNGQNGALGWIDDQTTATFHTYSCISIGNCIPTSFVTNTNLFWPSLGNAGVFLVRDGEAIPEPASLALLAGSLVGLGWTRRRRL